MARKPPRGVPATKTFNGKVYRWDGTWTEDRSAAMATAASRRDAGKLARVVGMDRPREIGARRGIRDYHLYVRGQARKKAPPRKKRKSMLDQLLDMGF